MSAAEPRSPLDRWILATVLVHLIISVAHGAIHSRAHVVLSPAATVFVVVVIIVGPVVGAACLWGCERLGGWIVAVTMAGSLMFGVVNHFILESADHVWHVAVQWRVLFGTTAVLLAVTEALSTGLAIRRVGWRRA